MSVLISRIANFLNKDYFGDDFLVNNMSSISNIKENNISFINKKGLIFDQTIKSLVIVISGFKVDKNTKASFIFSSNPRLDFIKIYNKFFNNKKDCIIADSAIVMDNCKIGNNVSIGSYSIIKENVSIDDGTIINNHVVIEANTIIGKNCYIKSGTVVGEDGFGFERDENGIPIRFPHLGNVIIKNNVEIGSKNTISRGTLNSTIIYDNVKLDDQVHIAHNCIIHENTIITACVEISGSVEVGRNCWIGPNSSLINGIKIADNTVIGIGCNIVSSVDTEKTKVAGIGNMSMREVIKLKKILGAK